MTAPAGRNCESLRRSPGAVLHAPGGRGRSAIALAVVLGVAFGAWLSAHRDLPWALFSGDEMEYAEIARRIADGRGFTTGIIFPVEIAWGVHEEHPSLLRPPLWPLVLSAAFRVAGPNEVAAHVAVMLCLLATVAVVFALGRRLSGLVCGTVAGLAVGLSPVLLLHAVLAGTEILLALWIALVFYALASERDPFWPGLVCGLAYLTRYNGALLLPVVLLTLARRPLQLAPLARCVLGFVLVCLPWWARNFAVTGEPFFSLYNLALWVTPEPTPQNGSLLYMIEPDLTSAAAMHPLRKAAWLLPTALSQWPLVAANLIAFVGALLACARRDRLCVAFFGGALLMKLAFVFVAIRGRYLIPFVPTLLALGTAFWMRQPSRFRRPALALTLLLPLLAHLPLEGSDIALTRTSGSVPLARHAWSRSPSQPRPSPSA